ncbi:MAG TPA: sodium/solute symporter [Spirochaetota bacterium]|nr:sodium/solute symporter [Spirochaetota bacterium]HPI89289.1 sodium/solute symporter [Spirochaetota bacterium]HPR47887.1 sodium/solute symporter [Spirochaetota bacterium]
MHLTITALDIVILAVYVLGTRFIFGWYITRRAIKESSEKYFLADRNLAWPIIGFSFYVSNMSGSSFVGLPGSGYHDGIAVYNYEWLPVPILVFFVFFILPFFLRARVFTAPGFLEQRYDSRSKLAFSGFLITANIFIDAAAALYSGGMIAKVLFPGIPLWQTCAVISCIAGIYIFFGGLDAVVLNDVLQAAMILLGGVIIAVMTWVKIPSWDAVIAAAPPHGLDLVRPLSDPFLPWPGIVSGVLIVGIYFWCTNQFVIQRALGARSLDHARRGSLFAGILKLPNLFILVLPGVMARALYPDIERADMVFPALAFDILPLGVRGLMLACLTAAILSSLESIYNSASTLFTMDFVKHFRPATEDRNLVRTGRAATLVFMALSALWAPQIERFPTLWQYLQSILSYITPPVVAVFLAGIFWKGAKGTAAFLTLAGGVPLGIAAWFANEIMGVFDIHYLYASGIMFVAGICFMITLSLMGRGEPDESAASLVWRPSFWKSESSELQGLPPYLNYRWLSLALLVLCAVLVVWWW